MVRSRCLLLLQISNGLRVRLADLLGLRTRLGSGQWRAVAAATGTGAGAGTGAAVKDEEEKEEEMCATKRSKPTAAAMRRAAR